MNEFLKCGATLIAEHIRDGKVIDTREVHNLVVDTGYDLVCALLANTQRPNPIGFVGVGTGTTATAQTMTGLVTEWGSRVSTTYSHTAGTPTLTLSCTIPTHTGSMVSLTESGLFNAATAGTMFDRVTFTAINKEPADTINIRYVINLAAE